MTSYIILAVIFLVFIIVIWQIGQLLELISVVRGKKDGDIAPSNNVLALLFGLLGGIFLIATTWSYFYFKPQFLPVSASVHGMEIDSMIETTFFFTMLVFFLTQIALFYFGFKYRYNSKRKARYFAHSNLLEIVWTVIPAIVLTILVIQGADAWYEITDEPAEDAYEIEATAYQFGWFFRYPGKDKEFGPTSYLLISAQNPVGIATKGIVEARLAELEAEIKEVSILREKAIEEEMKEEQQHGGEGHGEEHGAEGEHEEHQPSTLYDDNLKELRMKYNYLYQFYQKVQKESVETGKDILAYGKDDIMVASELRLPVNKEVLMKLRARDVLHSFFLPHFRVKMDCVPGIPTRFKFIPQYTTEEMRKLVGDPEFNYELACAEMCGKGHFGMQKYVYVEPEESIEKWLEEKPKFAAVPEEIPAEGK